MKLYEWGEFNVLFSSNQPNRFSDESESCNDGKLAETLLYGTFSSTLNELLRYLASKHFATFKYEICDCRDFEITSSIIYDVLYEYVLNYMPCLPKFKYLYKRLKYRWQCFVVCVCCAVGLLYVNWRSRTYNKSSRISYRIIKK